MLKLTVTTLVRVEDEAGFSRATVFIPAGIRNDPSAKTAWEVVRSSMFVTIGEIENKFEPPYDMGTAAASRGISRPGMPSDAKSVYRNRVYLVETPEQICKMIALFRQAEFEAKNCRSAPMEELRREWPTRYPKTDFPSYVVISAAQTVEIRY